MLIDPNRTIVLCYQYGGFDDKGTRLWKSLKLSAIQWIISTFPKENIVGINHSPYLCARNRPIRDLIVPTADKYDWVLSIDYDVTITHPGVENFLKTEGDLVACKCAMENPTAWKSKDAFHLSLWRGRTEIFRKVPPPWFTYPYSDDGCELLDCDCGNFAKMVIAAGFSVNHGGHCGHNCGTGSYQRPIGHKPERLYRGGIDWPSADK